jgi:ribonuclease HII
MNSQPKYIIGIDEAGRGPIAGPVAVGGVMVLVTGDQGLVTSKYKTLDSKKLSAKKRAEIFDVVKKDKANYQWAVSLVSEQVIDSEGIAFALRLGVQKVLAKLKVDPVECLVLLDGALKAPVEFINQKTIIRGDATETLIGLASICAKVTRDDFMLKAHIDFPMYGFDQHKGYGTTLHYECLKTHGPCPIHRQSFLKNL